MTAISNNSTPSAACPASNTSPGAGGAPDRSKKGLRRSRLTVEQRRESASVEARGCRRSDTVTGPLSAGGAYSVDGVWPLLARLDPSRSQHFASRRCSVASVTRSRAPVVRNARATMQACGRRHTCRAIPEARWSCGGEGGRLRMRKGVRSSASVEATSCLADLASVRRLPI